MAVSMRQIALGAIFGAILAVNGFIPGPTSDFLIVFQSFLLAISFLVLGRGGASLEPQPDGQVQQLLTVEQL